MKHNHLCLHIVAVAAGESVSRAATPAIRAICAALSAQMSPLAPLKVADITGGLDDISGRFCCVKIRFRPKMANISGWMMYPVDDITGFYRKKTVLTDALALAHRGEFVGRTGAHVAGVGDEVGRGRGPGPAPVDAPAGRRDERADAGPVAQVQRGQRFAGKQLVQLQQHVLVVYCGSIRVSFDSLQLSH